MGRVQGRAIFRKPALQTARRGLGRGGRAGCIGLAIGTGGALGFVLIKLLAHDCAMHMRST